MSQLELTVLPVGPLQTNAYLLAAPAAGEAMLVDPGEEPTRLLANLADSNCRLTQLVCTHGHFDHVMAAAAVQEAHDLPLRCHPLDAQLIRRMPEIQSAYGFPGTPVPRVEDSLSDGVTLTLGRVELTVRHVPGHSPGHVMIGWEGHVLVGDCIFAGSIGRTDLPGGSFADLERSIQERIYTLPDNTRLHPGHGPETTVGREKQQNPFVRPRTP
jgi:glyoxylase-like metal-dependent hydrolase (beta-lactamase superfamily II)